MRKILNILIKAFVLSALFTIHYSLFTRVAYAMCPACTVAVAGGLGLSRWLGIDDTVSGVWLGGLILSSSLWFINWFKKKKPEFPIFKREAPSSAYFQFPIIFVLYLLVLLPLAWADIIGHPFNTLWGIDKLIFGIAAGSLGFWASIFADKKVREINGKQYFNFQKVVFPVSFLAIISAVFYFLTK